MNNLSELGSHYGLEVERVLPTESALPDDPPARLQRSRIRSTRSVSIRSSPI